MISQQAKKERDCACSPPTLLAIRQHVWLKYERTAIFNCHSSKASLLLATRAKLRNPRQLVVKQQERGLWVVVSML